MADGGEQNSRAFQEVVINDLGRAYLEALLARDEPGAEVAVRDAIDARLSSSQVDQGIIAPALWLVGELSRRGEISCTEGRIAGEISVRVMALQREARRVCVRTRRAPRDARRSSRRAACRRAGDGRVIA
jgi:hypothetical protein